MCLSVLSVLVGFFFNSSSFVNQQRKIYHHADAVSSSAGAVQVVINKTEKNI